MKQIFKKSVGIFAFLSLFMTLTNCVNESLDIPNQETSVVTQLKTELKLEEFTNQNLAVNWDNIHKIDKENFQIYEIETNEINPTKIKSNLFQSDLKHELIAVKKGDEIFSYVIKAYSSLNHTLFPGSIQKLENFTGTLMVFDLNGKKLDELVIFNGTSKNVSGNSAIAPLHEAINLFASKKNLTSKSNDCYLYQTIYTTSTFYTDHYYYITVGNYTGLKYSSTTSVTFTTSSTTVVPSPCGNKGQNNFFDEYYTRVTDQIDELPDSLDPCNQLKAQNANADFKAKITELGKKTRLKNETGYAQKKDGSYQTLTNSGGDQLNFANDKTTIGFMHTHLDPYETGQYNSDGEPIINSPIQMFSPADVKSFISLLINANRNSIPLSDVYGTMVASNGVYQLRFEGNYSDINTGLNFDGLDKEYKDYFRKISNSEKAFVLFLKDQIGINGISLFKLKSDGSSEKKSLDTNNKLTTTPCQ